MRNFAKESMVAAAMATAFAGAGSADAGTIVYERTGSPIDYNAAMIGIWDSSGLVYHVANATVFEVGVVPEGAVFENVSFRVAGTGSGSVFMAPVATTSSPFCVTDEWDSCTGIYSRSVTLGEGILLGAISAASDPWKTGDFDPSWKAVVFDAISSNIHVANNSEWAVIAIPDSGEVVFEMVYAHDPQWGSNGVWFPAFGEGNVYAPGKSFQIYETNSWWDITVSVTTPAVPEPETYAMFVAGLGLLGAAARRRRTAA